MNQVKKLMNIAIKPILVEGTNEIVQRNSPIGFVHSTNNVNIRSHCGKLAT
jgi:hypothetical protein